MLPTAGFSPLHIRPHSEDADARAAAAVARSCKTEVGGVGAGWGGE